MNKNNMASVSAVELPEISPPERSKRDPCSRSPALDIIRIFACINVLSIHFLMNGGFYSEPILGGRMCAMLFMRALFMCCVPLFLMLSGYLLCNKMPERKYYGRIWRIIFVYLAASLFCVYGYRFLYNRVCGLMGNEPIDFAPLGVGHLLELILDYEAGRYAWYIEMYLGLFLCIPFLNVMYQKLPSKKVKQVLILTGFVLSILPNLVNSFNFTQPGWWANPTMRDQNGTLYTYTNLIPDYWLSLFPFTYYFVGCYLREYGLKIKLWKNALLLACSIALYGGFSLWRSWGTTFVSGTWSMWNNPFVFSVSVLVFCFFLNCKYRWMPTWLRNLLAYLSELTLGAYLVSGTFDNLVYPYIKQQQPIVFQRLDLYIIVVPFVFVCSMLVSWMIHLLYTLLQRSGRLLRKKT